MRRRKNSFRKEKIMIISASAFVLTALTMAGVYVREQSRENDEYRVDLSELDHEKLADKTSEIGEHMKVGQNGLVVADDLDADPDFWEANSPRVEGHLSEQWKENVISQEAAEQKTNAAGNAVDEGEVAKGNEDETIEAGADTVIMANYNFPELLKMEWPLCGELLMNYSMDKTVYFETLGQYRYNPALIIKAEPGAQVCAAANGIVKEVSKSAELGNAIVIDIGDGYELTYGQLENITVAEGDVVETGNVLGNISLPSAYYSKEGSNLYLKMTKDGIAMNPMDVLP